MFQPSILKTFSNIWESEYGICDDWSDLIEFVIHKFINTPAQVPLSLPNTFIVQPVPIVVDQKIVVWTKEEIDTLYWYYIQSKSKRDVIGAILQLFDENGNSKKGRIPLIQQLLIQHISLQEFDSLMTFEDSQYVRPEHIPNETKEGSSAKESKSIDDIKVLKDRLLKENKGNLIYWLQKVLMECCFIKLKLDPSHESNALMEKNKNLMEPIPYHYICKY